MGREKKNFLEGGIGQGENFSDHIFLKFSGGGYAWGTTKKIQEGDVGREIKNIGGRYEFRFLR